MIVVPWSARSRGRLLDCGQARAQGERQVLEDLLGGRLGRFERRPAERYVLAAGGLLASACGDEMGRVASAGVLDESRLEPGGHLFDYLSEGQRKKLDEQRKQKEMERLLDEKAAGKVMERLLEKNVARVQDDLAKRIERTARSQAHKLFAGIREAKAVRPRPCSHPQFARDFLASRRALRFTCLACSRSLTFDEAELFITSDGDEYKMMEIVRRNFDR